MRVTTAGYASVVRQLVEVAPNGSIVFVTEGGYDLGALSDCLDASIGAITGTSDLANARLNPGSTARAERALDAVRAAQKPFWHGV
jgi:acetoin utilization deacetylase AcuC-like enzyme